jgi:hypothetical protein
MKTLLLIVAALVLSLSAQAQGYFIFNTRNPGIGVNVRFVDWNGLAASGPDLFVQVFAGPSPDTLQPLNPPLPLNRTGLGAGYTAPFTYIYAVPEMESGTAFVAYQAFKGESWDTAVMKSPLITMRNNANLSPTALSVVLASPGTFPDEVDLGSGTVPICVPEPVNWALSLLSVATAACP